MDLESLPLECVEILQKITPNQEEVKKFQQFSQAKKNAHQLEDNDRFLYEVDLVVYGPITHLWQVGHRLLVKLVCNADLIAQEIKMKAYGTVENGGNKAYSSNRIL